MRLPCRSSTSASASSGSGASSSLQVSSCDRSKRRGIAEPQGQQGQSFFPSRAAEDVAFKKPVCRNLGNIDARLRAVEGTIQDAVAVQAQLLKKHGNANR